jgi:hypothetical protein
LHRADRIKNGQSLRYRQECSMTNSQQRDAYGKQEI